MRNLANILTLIRIALIPVIVIIYFSQLAHITYPFNIPTNANIVILILFIIASITDYLDGYVARKQNTSNALGEFLDPVADKLLVVTMLILIVDLYQSPLISICVIIIIMREISISAIREWMSKQQKAKAVKVSSAGKLKTATQFLAIIFLFYWGDIATIASNDIGIVLLCIATVLTVYSGIQYLKIFLQHIND